MQFRTGFMIGLFSGLGAAALMVGGLISTTILTGALDRGIMRMDILSNSLAEEKDKRWNQAFKSGE